MHTRLTSVIAAARLAITGQAAPLAIPPPALPPLSALTAGTRKGQDAQVRLSAPTPPQQTPAWGSEGLPEISRRLLDVLRRLARDVTVVRGQERATTAVFHLPAELLAAHAQISRPTLYAHLCRLADRGLIAHRSHKTTSAGKTRCSGTVWAVAMAEGHQAQVRWYDLRHDWRNLDADRATGRTVWAALQSMKTNQEEITYTQVRGWALGEIDPAKLVGNDCKPAQEAVWAIASLHHLSRPARLTAITETAQTVSVALRDEHSARFYGSLMHRATEAENHSPGTLSRLVYALQRALVDARESQALRRPGALLVSRLRAGGSSGRWDDLAPA